MKELRMTIVKNNFQKFPLEYERLIGPMLNFF